MPDGLNKITLVGYIVEDPDVRFTEDGNALTKFRLVVHRSYLVEKERRTTTERHQIVTTDRLAEEVGQKLRQGDKALVEGRLETRVDEGPEGRRYFTDVIAFNVLSLGSAGLPEDFFSLDREPDDGTESLNLPEGLNRAQLIGNLGKDPEMRYTANGSAVTTFNVAVGRRVLDAGEWQEKTEWTRVVAFSRLAERAGNYLAKGRKVYVEGRLTTRSWEAADGQRRFTTEVVADQLLFLDSRQGGGAPYPGSGGDIDLDDIPFEG